QRVLAVTCFYNGSTVRIRVQLNDLPGRWTSIPSTDTFFEQNIDLEVDFNSTISFKSPI
ncbi:unnamed protein product, partial [Rotaria sp. Silwood1]